MLDFSSIASIRDEIDRAEYFRDLHLQTPKELREWFCGQGYRDGYGVNHPENAVHAYISMVLPRIIHDNPKVRMTSARPQVQRTACVAMKAALNRWSKMTKVRGTIERIATDMLLGWGVSLTVNEPKGHERKWDGDGPYLPRVYRIDPARFIIDPAAMHWEEARFMGHVWVTDKEDLLRRAEMDETWNKEVIEGLATNNGVDELRDSRDIPERYELAIYEIWVPEMDEAAAELIDEAADDALFNGTIWTIAKYQGGTDKCECQLIRKPLPYYGPATGPYTVFGAFTVPNDPYPLSPIVACRDQIQYCNDMALSQQENQKRYKRILVGDAKNPKFLQDVVNAPDMYVFAEAGLDARSLQPVEVGGSTNQHIQSVETAKERLDRALGMSDAMRGNVAGSASATEVAVAESASTMRIAHLKRAFQDACDTVFRNVGWYMFHDGRISIPVGGEDTRAVGMTCRSTWTPTAWSAPARCCRRSVPWRRFRSSRPRRRPSLPCRGSSGATCCRSSGTPRTCRRCRTSSTSRCSSRCSRRSRLLRPRPEFLRRGVFRPVALPLLLLVNRRPSLPVRRRLFRVLRRGSDAFLRVHHPRRSGHRVRVRHERSANDRLDLRPPDVRADHAHRQRGAGQPELHHQHLSLRQPRSSPESSGREVRCAGTPDHSQSP